MGARFIIGADEFSAETLDGFRDSYLEFVKRHRRVLVYSASRAAYVVALELCREAGCHLLIVPSARSPSEVQPHLAEWDVSLIISDARNGTLVYEELEPKEAFKCEPGVSVFTSGSTGKPKLAQHTWESISASAQFTPKRLFNAVWFLAYEPAAYAGLQVYFAARAANGTLVIPEKLALDTHIRLISDAGVNVISATPTWWRLIISAWPGSIPAPVLDQATMGGEMVSQSTIDLVAKFFGPRNLTHIYASTEAGTSIVVSDGKEGFPVAMLDERAEVGLRVRNEILEVNTSQGMSGYFQGSRYHADDWFNTGDRVEVRDDRCYFIGRNDGRINVGGTKIQPEEVETALLQLPEIENCYVYSRKSPLVGSVLSADIVLSKPGQSSPATIQKQLAEVLPGSKIPQYIRFVDQVGMSSYGKKTRA